MLSHLKLLLEEHHLPCRSKSLVSGFARYYYLIEVDSCGECRSVEIGDELSCAPASVDEFFHFASAGVEGITTLSPGT